MEVSGRNQIGSEDVETGIECDPCLFDRKTVTAELFCKDCNIEVHRKNKVSRSHNLLHRDEMPRKKLTTVQEKFCSNHANRQIEYFCGKHKQFCCSVCVTLRHSQCGVLYIDDIAGGFNTSLEYQNLLKQIKVVEIELTETKKQSEKNCEDVNQYFTSLISDIQHFRSQIDTKLDELEKKVKEEAQKIKEDDLKFMGFISAQIESIQKHLTEISSTLESLEKYKQNHQLFISSKHYFADVIELKKEMGEISFKSRIKKYSFQCNEDILNSLENCCKLKVSEFQSIMNRDPEHNMKVKFVKKINILHKQDSSSDSLITGSDLLTCDTLALTDGDNSSIEIVDLHSDTVTSCLQLADKPIDLTCMDLNTLVVTCWTKLTFLKYDGKLSIMKKVPMEDGCHGITSHQNKLFVTFQKNISVKILNSRGEVLHTIRTNSQGQNLFVKPEYVTLSRDGQTIYVSDLAQNTVTSYSVKGKQVNIYKHHDLEYPAGLTVIENNCVLVCGARSANLHEISCLCEHIQIVLDRKNVGGPPRTVLYNRTNNMIYISYGGCRGNNSVSVFKLE